MKKSLFLFLLIVLMLIGCGPTPSCDVPPYIESSFVSSSSISSETMSVFPETEYRIAAVTDDGKQILTDGNDYKVTESDGALICQYDSVQWVARTSEQIILAPYIAMKRSNDGMETYYLLDENFKPVGETYRLIYHYGLQSSDYIKDPKAPENDYYIGSKDGNVYKILPTLQITELRHGGPSDEYLLNRKYQVTVYWVDIDYCYKGLLDAFGNSALECEYLQIYEVLPDRIYAVTGSSIDSSLARAWLFDENLNLLTNGFNSLFFVVSTDGYVGIGYSEGNNDTNQSGMIDPGKYFIDKDGNAIFKAYASIGNIRYVEGEDYVLKNDPTLDFICTLPDGTSQMIPFADIMIPFN